ncbi:hypothetical protein J6590_058289 [Homalodisca vitripennis]|nr:hypothetical protein J6590_058289 [Homalodisca vitripennis]
MTLVDGESFVKTTIRLTGHKICQDAREVLPSCPRGEVRAGTDLALLVSPAHSQPWVWQVNVLSGKYFIKDSPSL